MSLPATKRFDDTIAAPTAAKKSFREKLSRGTVGWTEDAKRIFALPRRQRPDLEAIADELTARLKRPEGTQRLRPMQAWALHEAPTYGGLLGAIEIGGGKTLTGLLMPMVWPKPTTRPLRAVLFIPPALRVQLLQYDWEHYGKHWVLPNLADGKKFVTGRPVLHVVAYSELSNPKASNLLEQLAPDLIICDEFHNLKNKDSARVRRFLRYLTAHHDVRVCGWSGTLTSKSLYDYAHLSAVALDSGSPVPISPSVVEQWAAALDPTEIFFDAGVLKQLCVDGETVRSGFRRRLVETPGFVSSPPNRLGMSLVFYQREVAVPRAVSKELTRLRADWVRPDGEEFCEAIQVSECARQLAVGMYLRWKFPRGEPEKLINEWFTKRQNWNRELRAKLQHAEPYLDSPKLCEDAAKRFFDGGCTSCERGALQPHGGRCRIADVHPLWHAETYPAWRGIEDKVYHETEVIWLDEFAVDNAAHWASERPGIVWVEHPEFGHRLSRKSRLPYFGGGEKAAEAILRETGERSIVVSINARSEGLNLQRAFSRNLFVTPMPDAKTMAQAIGRTYRDGQPADEVEVWAGVHTAELRSALQKLRGRARYVTDTMIDNVIANATWSFSP